MEKFSGEGEAVSGPVLGTACYLAYVRTQGPNTGLEKQNILGSVMYMNGTAVVNNADDSNTWLWKIVFVPTWWSIYIVAY